MPQLRSERALNDQVAHLAGAHRLQVPHGGIIHVFHGVHALQGRAWAPSATSSMSHNQRQAPTIQCFQAGRVRVNRVGLNFGAALAQAARPDAVAQIRGPTIAGLNCWQGTAFDQLQPTAGAAGSSTCESCWV